jgi:adenylate cyclase
MAIEIERKFLLASEDWRQAVERSIDMQQGFFCNTDKASLRVRIENDQARIGIKSMSGALRRSEFEYEIPLHEARILLESFCQPSIIRKTRHLLHFGEHLWEIDEFHGDNEGLVVAEIELKDENEAFLRPPWLGREVSAEPDYLNFRLAVRPFRDWTT